jgi:hypothetical protein
MATHTLNDMEPAFLATNGKEALGTKGGRALYEPDCGVLQLDAFIKFGMRKVLSQNMP